MCEMETIDKAKQIVLKCEEDLSKLGADTLLARDYVTAAKLADVAQALGRLAAGLGSAILVHGATTPSADPAVRPAAASTFRRATEYPKFYRRGDGLIRVGWSKKYKEEYTHKSPKSVLTATVTAVAALGVGGKRFTAEELLSRVGHGIDAESSAYQVYACLAWLRSIGLVQQHGREGYSSLRLNGLPEEVERRWQTLPLWQER